MTAVYHPGAGLGWNPGRRLRLVQSIRVCPRNSQDGSLSSSTSFDQPPASAAQCRERARRCFERAIVEESLTARETFLRQGEDWMLRWRTWGADDTRAAAGNA